MAGATLLRDWFASPLQHALRYRAPIKGRMNHAVRAVSADRSTGIPRSRSNPVLDPPLPLNDTPPKAGSSRAWANSGNPIRKPGKRRVGNAPDGAANAVKETP